MKTTSKVARLITSRIEVTGKLQKDIAAKVGFEKPNMITMIKQGRTHLPLDKIGPMALALEIDPLYLLQLCMEEYHPATWKAIAPLLTGQPYERKLARRAIPSHITTIKKKEEEETWN